MHRIKNILFGLIFIFPTIIFSQNKEKKEVVYLLFESKSEEKCKINVEQTFKNKKGIKSVKKYRKEYKRGKTNFFVCDEKFLFDVKKQKIDTCNIQSLKMMNIKDIGYLKDKYYNGEDFKHHTFKKINIVEKISDDKIIKYLDVYWCCEWEIE